MKLILALLAALALSGCFPDCSSMTDEGNLEGRINTDSGHCDFNHGDLTVNSGGGNIDDAINMANYISEAGGTVTVKSQCSSACVLLLAAASNRRMCFGGHIGLHQGNRKAATEKMVDYMAQDERINLWMVGYIISLTPHDDIYRVSAYEAMQYGLIDEIVNCN